jgi:hypothetical protein
MLVVRCTYNPPRIGDVALISGIWHDDELSVFTPHYVHVPVVNGVAWWHWVATEPAPIQQALHNLFDEELREGDEPYAS